MQLIIDNFDFWNMETEHYWSSKNIGEKLRKEIHDAVYSGDYFAARKVDGQWGMAIKDMNGDLYLRPRSESVNGGYPNKIDWIPQIHPFLNNLPNGTVLLGEIYFPNKEGSRNVTTIMGCLPKKALDRQEKGDKLSFYLFDILAYNGKSLIDIYMEDRIKQLYEIYNNSINRKFIVCGKYYEGKELEEYIAWIREHEYEGVVLQYKKGTYEPGKRPAHKSIKIKKELDQSIDCFLTGNYKNSTWEYTGKEIADWIYWFDIKNQAKIEGKLFEEYQAGRPIEPITKGAFYNWAGSIELGIVDKEGNIKPVAWISNITEEVKNGIINDNENWKYRVVKLQAMMQEDDTGMFRHAKIIEWRNPNDKKWIECIL